jgi:quercetin dioxygenase-like cupin family protein
VTRDGWSTPSLLPGYVVEHALSETERNELSEWFASLSVFAEARDESALSRGKARLLASVNAPRERFAPLFKELSSFFDLSAEALRNVFERAADATEWQPGPLPWVSLFHLQGGPSLAGLDTGLVRLKKGMPFPPHRHTDSERVLILEGGYHDSAGHWYGPGDLHAMNAGTEHSLQMSADKDVLLAVILSGEIQVLGA